MTTTNAAMNGSVDWVPLAAADVASLVPGFYTLDEEHVEVGLPHTAYAFVGFNLRRVFNGRFVVRGVGGSTPASHDSGTELVRYFPEAPSGGDGAITVTADVDYTTLDDSSIAVIEGVTFDGPCWLSGLWATLELPEGVLVITPEFYILHPEWVPEDVDAMATATKVASGGVDAAQIAWTLDLDTPSSGTFRLEVTTDAFGETIQETDAFPFDVSASDLVDGTGLPPGFKALAGLENVNDVIVVAVEGGFRIIFLDIVGDNLLNFVISDDSLVDADPTLTSEPIIPEGFAYGVGGINYNAGEVGPHWLPAGTYRLGAKLQSGGPPTGGTAKVLLRVES